MLLSGPSWWVHGDLPLQRFVAKSLAGRFCSGGPLKIGAAYRAMGLPAFQWFRALSLLRSPSSPYRARGLLRRAQELDQRALDRRLARRLVDLRADQIRDVEHVDHPLPERRHMGRGDVEPEPRDGRGQFIEQAGAVEPDHLDHGEAVRPLIVEL